MAYEQLKGFKRNGLEEFLFRLTNLQIAIPLMFVMLFLWINGTGIWGAYWEQSTALVYILMFAFVLSITSKSSFVWITKVRFKEGALHFFIGFMLMFAGLIILDRVLNSSLSSNTIASSAIYPAIALTAFFVAPVEETIFRGVLKEYTKDWKLYFLPLGIILTSGAFAITHYAVYGGQIQPIWWAFLMGGVFYLGSNFRPSKKNGPMGVPGAIGMHTCYNLFILGILSGGIV